MPQLQYLLIQFIIHCYFITKKGLNSISIPNEQVIGKYIGEDIKDKSGEILIGTGFDITEEQLAQIIELGEKSLDIVNIDPINKGPYILETLKIDKNVNKSEALNDIYKILRPGEAPTVEIAEQIFNNLYFLFLILSDNCRIKKLSIDINFFENVSIVSPRQYFFHLSSMVILKSIINFFIESCILLLLFLHFISFLLH